jgi:hypothetical protein
VSEVTKAIEACSRLGSVKVEMVVGAERGAQVRAPHFGKRHEQTKQARDKDPQGLWVPSGGQGDQLNCRILTEEVGTEGTGGEKGQQGADPHGLLGQWNTSTSSDRLRPEKYMYG